MKSIEFRNPNVRYKALYCTTNTTTTTVRHKGIPGNELADTAAKAAALTNSDPPRPISYASTRFLIRRTFTDPSPTNSRTAEVYGGFSWSKDSMATSN